MIPVTIRELLRYLNCLNTKKEINTYLIEEYLNNEQYGLAFFELEQIEFNHISKEQRLVVDRLKDFCNRKIQVIKDEINNRYSN